VNTGGNLVENAGDPVIKVVPAPDPELLKDEGTIGQSLNVFVNPVRSITRQAGQQVIIHQVGLLLQNDAVDVVAIHIADLQIQSVVPNEVITLIADLLHLGVIQSEVDILVAIPSPQIAAQKN